MNVIENSTFYIALILELVGIVLYLVDYFALLVFAGLGLIGFVLLLIAWILFILGVEQRVYRDFIPSHSFSDSYVVGRLAQTLSNNHLARSE